MSIYKWQGGTTFKDSNVDMYSACLNFFPDHQPLNILKGHSGKVTCLLYPNEENPRYDVTHLVSGGADFTVRLWDVFNGTLLHAFNSHGGEVVKLLVTPPDCTVSDCLGSGCTLNEHFQVDIFKQNLSLHKLLNFGSQRL